MRSPLFHPHPQFEGLLPSFDSRVIKGELVLSDDGSAVLVPRIRHHVEVGRPHLKLPLPVDDGGERGADQERTLSVTLRDKDEGEEFIHSSSQQDNNRTEGAPVPL